MCKQIDIFEKSVDSNSGKTWDAYYKILFAVVCCRFASSKDFSSLVGK